MSPARPDQRRNGDCRRWKGPGIVSDTKGVQVFDSDGRYLNVFKPDGVASGMVFNDKNELFIVARNKEIKFGMNQ